MSSRLPTDLPQRISERMQIPLPGRAAQSSLAPELCYGRHHGPPPPDAKSAAVLVLLCDEHRWRIPMTLRPAAMSSHAGQVSFPGGMAERGETSEQTALRELEEELGIPGEGLRVLGQLTPLYVFASNFFVTPVLAIAQPSPDIRPQPAEVEQVVDVPLDLLLAGNSIGSHQIRRGAMSFRAPHIAVGRHRIWGASCMILGEVTALLREASVGS